MKYIVVLFAIFSILSSILEEKQKAEKRRNVQANKDFDIKKNRNKKYDSKLAGFSVNEEKLRKEHIKPAILDEESQIKRQEAEGRKLDRAYKSSRIPRVSLEKNNTSNNAYDIHNGYDCFVDSPIHNSLYKKNEASIDKEVKEETALLRLSDMQKYVVMKEILDKPVSLR